MTPACLIDKSMTKTLIFCAIVLLVMSSCIKTEFADNQQPQNPTTDWTKFDFSTSAKMNLDIRYQDMGGITASVYFEIYETCPVELNESGSAYRKIEGIEPIFADVTNDQGVYMGTAELPAYLKEAYVYTSAFYAQTLIKATIQNNTLQASDDVMAEPTVASLSTRASDYDSYVVKHEGWKTYLGDYAKGKNGEIQYTYKFDHKTEKKDLSASNFPKLYEIQSSVINASKDCPEEYRASKDLRIELKDGQAGARIGITFLGGNTCWNSSLGYYFYKDGHKPNSLAETDVIMIFPNTQDGYWSNNRGESQRFAGVKRGTTVKLKYYSDINNPSTGTDLFPDGYRIGFVLACNAWERRIGGFTQDDGYRAASTDNLSIDGRGMTYKTPRTAIYRYTETSKDIDAIMFSFEDHYDDDNYSDVVFTLVSDPIEAVVDVPSVDQDGDKQTVHTVKGSYAFEDLWPSRGDYDMNDVVIKADYEKTFNNRGILSESFFFKTNKNSYTGLTNGMAVTLNGVAASAEIKVSVKGPKDEAYTQINDFSREGNVLLITNDVKANANTTYKITASYTAPVTAGGSATPFIYSTTRKPLAPNMRWELHLPFEKPSDKADLSFFGTGDDRSIPEQNIYYIRQEMYPFAFFLSGATEQDLSKLLDPANESKAIDKLYPDYASWATSQGANNKDWYKK